MDHTTSDAAGFSGGPAGPSAWPVPPSEPAAPYAEPAAPQGEPAPPHGEPDLPPAAAVRTHADTEVLGAATDTAASAASARKHPHVLRRLTGIAVVAVLSGGAGAGVATVLDDDAAAPVTAAAATRSVALGGEPLDVAAVVDVAGPAVVSIQTQAGSRFPGGQGGGGAGTGVILTADGEILTNAHVVAGATEIRVTLAGESQSRRASLVGANAAEDLALVKLEDASGLPVAELGTSSDVAVGDDVVAIGNALALPGGPTVTRGIVSALDRSLQTGQGAMTGLLQTDASISSGNSGGPLVDAAGRVVGINTAVAASGGGRAAENVGFAIAIDQAVPVIEELRGGSVAADGYLGVEAADPTDGSRGAVVTSVLAGSAADQAGIEAGDLVTAVGDRRVSDAAGLGAAVQGHRPGDEVDVALVREGETLTVSARLHERPST